MSEWKPLAYEDYATVSPNTIYYSEILGECDLYLHVKDYLSTDLTEIDNSNSSYLLNGQGRLVKEFWIDCKPSSNDQYLSIENITLEDFSINGENFIIDQDLSTRTRGNSTSYNTNDSFFYRFSRNILINVQDLMMNQNDFILDSVYHFKIYARHTQIVNWYDFYGAISTNVSVSNNRAPTNNFIWLKSPFRFNKQILEALQNGNSDITTAINNASSQAHSDAQVAQSQAAQELDALTYDHSGTSQSVSATQSAYDAAQGVADAAVDAAVHSYTSDLSTVEAYDYSSFFSSQRNSAVFWRDVGEYILDSSNLGFVSGSVIIVTLIGLVIFMLRL